jgi:hypothetical protein
VSWLALLADVVVCVGREGACLSSRLRVLRVVSAALQHRAGAGPSKQRTKPSTALP